MLLRDDGGLNVVPLKNPDVPFEVRVDQDQFFHGNVEYVNIPDHATVAS